MRYEYILFSHDRAATQDKPAMTARQVMRGVLSYLAYINKPNQITDDLNKTTQEIALLVTQSRAERIPDEDPGVHQIYSDEAAKAAFLLESSLCITAPTYEMGQDGKVVEKTPGVYYPGYYAILHLFRRPFTEGELAAIRSNDIEVHDRATFEHAAKVRGFQ